MKVYLATKGNTNVTCEDLNVMPMDIKSKGHLNEVKGCWIVYTNHYSILLPKNKYMIGSRLNVKLDDYLLKNLICALHQLRTQDTQVSSSLTGSSLTEDSLDGTDVWVYRSQSGTIVCTMSFCLSLPGRSCSSILG